MTGDRAADLGKLQELVRRLRAPDGCPWDREQSLESMRAYLLEEAHEVAAAIDGGDPGELAEELGDLLFQVVFLGELGVEQGTFSLPEVVGAVHRKMVERHPHVFADAELPDTRSVKRAWERRKLAQEKEGRSLLAGIPASLPALVASYRITQKAAGVGFDWPSAREVLAKIEEELAEVAEALEAPAGEARQRALREEVGDLLFSVVNLARHLDIDPEGALAASNAKFRRRFQAVEEDLAARGRHLDRADLAEMEASWQRAKRAENPEP